MLDVIWWQFPIIPHSLLFCQQNFSQKQNWCQVSLRQELKVGKLELNSNSWEEGVQYLTEIIFYPFSVFLVFPIPSCIVCILKEMKVCSKVPFCGECRYTRDRKIGPGQSAQFTPTHWHSLGVINFGFYFTTMNKFCSLFLYKTKAPKREKIGWLHTDHLY